MHAVTDCLCPPKSARRSPAHWRGVFGGEARENNGLLRAPQPRCPVWQLERTRTHAPSFAEWLCSGRWGHRCDEGAKEPCWGHC